MTIDAPPIVPVLLCGGSGTRLWPASRAGLPKQFVPLVGPRTLLQETCLRVAPLAGERWIAVTNEGHRFLLREQAREVGVSGLRTLLEPVARNTAPAIAAAALEACRTGGDALLLVLPSDHVVEHPDAFRRAVVEGVPAATAGELVTFGVAPTRAETGFGYIRAAAADGSDARPIAAFVEKPDAATAERYLHEGHHLWNSGVFLFRATRVLEELGRFRPAMRAGVEAAWTGGRDDPELGFFRLADDPFIALDGESIDHAVLEQTERAVVVPLEAGWDDAGSWDALWRLGTSSPDGNVVIGDAEVIDTTRCYIRANDRLVACIGIDDLVVVETRDVVLVAERSATHRLRALVDRLRDAGRPEADESLRVPRPWGSYEVLDRGHGFQVKRITVLPGGTLSLQYHHHRAEQWVVVKGTATVTRDDETFTVESTRSVEIPQGAVHRLANRGDDLLEIIEVQSGDYLGEDDIVRLDDRYGRTDVQP